MKHVWEQHTNCEDPYCPICEGGLALCTVCKAGECELTTDCPGRPTTDGERRSVCEKVLDYINGRWIVPDLI